MQRKYSMYQMKIYEKNKCEKTLFKRFAFKTLSVNYIKGRANVIVY